MNHEAAHLIDRVLPWVPYRQWVLSLPFRARLLLAKRPRLLGKVGTLFMRPALPAGRFRGQGVRAATRAPH